MLACGQICRPSRIDYEIETFPSSTRPALVGTDAGIGYIKGISNPAGTCALISELISAELGTWFGLQIPPFSIVDRCDIDIPMQLLGRRIEPPCFYSHKIKGAVPFDNTGAMLGKLRDKDDIVRLVVFDTWIRNNDRFFEGSANSDNLLFSKDPEYDLYLLNPIDHSHCIAEADFLDALPDQHCANDERIYGFFPQFVPYVSREAVSNALSQLGTLPRSFVEDCVNQIPPQWGATGQVRTALVNFICNRAAYVVQTIANRLLASPGLPGVGA
jgi:hypothetical protein